jgi:hypothetical protein
LAVLIAYLDESGDVDTPLLTIAGYLSNEHKWKRFEREWRKCLKEYGVSYLHMREFTQSRNEFKDWPESKRRAFVKQITWIIKSAVMFRVGIVVPCAYYRDTVGKVEPQNTQLTPFWCCFVSCISAILVYCKNNGIRDDLALAFDENNQPSRHAAGYYASLKELPDIENRHQLVSLTFADDKKVPPLQAADLLAYELNKYHQGFVRKPLEMLDGTPGVFGVWTQAMLDKYAADLAKRKRIADGI